VRVGEAVRGEALPTGTARHFGEQLERALVGPVVSAPPDHGVVERDRAGTGGLGLPERGEEQVRVGRVAELGGAADEQRREAREEAAEGGRGDEQAMDLVELPLAGAVLEEAR